MPRASKRYFTARYYDEHADDFAGQSTQLFTVPAPVLAARSRHMSLKRCPSRLGPTTLTCTYIQVLTQPVGSAALDDVYGVLGVDALDQLRSYTFDYKNMRFRESVALNAEN